MMSDEDDSRSQNGSREMLSEDDLQLLLHLDLSEGSQESTPAPQSHHLEEDPTNKSEKYTSFAWEWAVEILKLCSRLSGWEI